ncbi:RadC family protein [Metabacillus herbersteinensis]|uniref:RadC family protein n=1 Tax=Metabacillus herbersteinensis TaxID=283816 RepID=UPI00406BD7A8
MKEFNVNIREEMTFYGVENTPLQHLLSIITGNLDSGISGNLAGIGIRRLAEMSEYEIMDFGISKKAAQRIVASFGLIGHYLKTKDEEQFVVRSPEDCSKLFDDIKWKQQEHFVVAYLDTKNKVISKKTLFIGTLNASIVHPRDVFREAVRLNAASFVCSHNHPSSDTRPSREDIEVTKRLADAGKMVGIELLDHIIIGSSGYVSLKEKGYV